MVNRLRGWIKEWWSNMIGKVDVSGALNIDVDMSSLMALELEIWGNMYTNDASWLGTYVKSLNLAASISGEIARSATIEMKVELDGSVRADFLTEQLDIVMDRLRDELEYGCAKGGLMIKPYLQGDKLGFDFVQADQFYPVSFGTGGRIESVVFSDQRKVGKFWYTRLEFHEFTPDNYHVRNSAFKSDTQNVLGREVPLASVQAWEDLAPDANISGIIQPLFAYFRYPQANNIDPTSPLGVSAFARSTELIEQADKLWSDMIWEFDSGKRALYVDELAFDKDSEDKPIIRDKRLYRTLKLAGQVGKDEMFEEWSPEFREAAILNGLNAILKRIEFNCNLAYGTLSDPMAIDKTATEILSSKQRSAALIVDMQKSIKTMMDQLLYAMDTWADIGQLSARGSFDVEYSFDDSLVTDREKQFVQDQTAVGMFAMSKVQFVMRNYDLPEEAAKKWVADAELEMPDDNDELSGA